MTITTDEFVTGVWDYYARHGRYELPWRLPLPDGSFDPYRILVSEVMLQQTQVGRVIDKYHQFLDRFPAVQVLAQASLGEVLMVWQGLGYNRRAKFLWQAAQMVVNDFGGRFPHGRQELIRLPGVGLNTAGAMLAYAYDEPVVFIETNIRSVFIHHFFAGQTDVPDKSIAELGQAALPVALAGGGGARQWYWALMDYGTFIKQQHGNTARASKSYARQSPFAGSRRQVRGAVIRQLTLVGEATADDLASMVADRRLVEVLQDLVGEGMVAEAGPAGSKRYRLA